MKVKVPILVFGLALAAVLAFRWAACPPNTTAGCCASRGLARFARESAVADVVHAVTGEDGRGCPVARVEGFVAPGYESVRDVFERSFHEGYDLGASVAAYVAGEKVVDLSGGYYDRAGERPYDADALQIVFSSTKVVESLVMAMLVDRGHISYDSRISSVWPEFAQHGKEHVTLQDLMMHRSGLAVMDTAIPYGILSDPAALAEHLASQPLHGPSAGVPAYHAVTRGLYASLICRRVDPQQRSLNQFFQEEVAQLLGIDMHIGLDEALESRVSPLHPAPSRAFWLSTIPRMLLPTWLTEAYFPSDPYFAISPRESGFLSQLFFDSSSPAHHSMLKAIDFSVEGFDITNTREYRAPELPSSNGVTNAAALARVAALIADGGLVAVGERDYKVLIRDITLLMASAFSEPETDRILDNEITYTTGGWAVLATPGGGTPSFGWGGVGGSQVRWNLETEAGFSYVMNQLGSRLSLNEPRGNSLWREVLWCAGKRSSRP